MEKEYIKASEYAKKMSLNVRTVYRYYHNGKIKGYHVLTPKSWTN